MYIYVRTLCIYLERNLIINNKEKIVHDLKDHDLKFNFNVSEYKIPS